MTKSMSALNKVSSIHRAKAQCHCVKAHVHECAAGSKIKAIFLERRMYV
jgi:hypothetical protein